MNRCHFSGQSAVEYPVLRARAVPKTQSSRPDQNLFLNGFRSTTGGAEAVFVAENICNCSPPKTGHHHLRLQIRPPAGRPQPRGFFKEHQQICKSTRYALVPESSKLNLCVPFIPPSDKLGSANQGQPATPDHSDHAPATRGRS